MQYNRVYLEAIGYELPPVVVTSQELEHRLAPVYQALRLPEGQLEALTGIVERRWWEPGFPLSQGAVQAARKALEASNVMPEDIGILIYGASAASSSSRRRPAGSRRRWESEPETVYDISNACLGVLNGIVDVANRIELGQIRAGLVVSCETAREINDAMIDELVASAEHGQVPHLVGYVHRRHGAVAVLVTDGSFSVPPRRRLLGGTTQSAPQYHGLCRWGMEGRLERRQANHVSPIPSRFCDMASISACERGRRSCRRLGWARSTVDKIICHQVGSGHRDSILKTLGISPDKDYSTYCYLGNMGTVSLPLTAALAEEREFLRPGDRVGLLGIGSGLNCLMLGVEW